MTNRPMSSQIGVDPMERKKTCKNKKKPYITLILSFPPYYVFKEKYTNKDLSRAVKATFTTARYTRLQLGCNWQIVRETTNVLKELNMNMLLFYPRHFSILLLILHYKKKRKKQNKTNIPSSCIRMLVFSRFLARATSWSVTLVQIRILNTAKTSTIKTKCLVI